METLIEIIAELRAENAQLKDQLAEQTERAEENSKGMIYWWQM